MHLLKIKKKKKKIAFIRKMTPTKASTIAQNNKVRMIVQREMLFGRLLE
jgi:hypothetical protein